MGAEDTITQAELAEALRQHLRGHRAGLVVLGSPDEVAADIMGLARRSREPEYQPGCAYQANDGLIFLRSNIGDWVDRSGSRWHDDVPIRPLRKLVPEPALTGEPLVWAITEELDDQTGLARSDCIDIARRICKLIEGACDGS